MGQKVTLGESQELFLFGAYHKYWEIKGMHIFFRYSGVGGDKCQGNSSKSEKQLKKKEDKVYIWHLLFAKQTFNMHVMAQGTVISDEYFWRCSWVHAGISVTCF